MMKETSILPFRISNLISGGVDGTNFCNVFLPPVVLAIYCITKKLLRRQVGTTLKSLKPTFTRKKYIEITICRLESYKREGFNQNA